MPELTYQDVTNQDSPRYITTDNVLMMILNAILGNLAPGTGATFEADPVLVAVDGNIAGNTCNSIEFYNQGDDPVTINGTRVLNQGQSWAVNGFPNETISTAYAYLFEGTGANPGLIITQKIYN